MKKGQLTIFIILGLVIISIFGFVFFITVNLQKQEQQVQAEKLINEILQTTSLRFYVNQCTEKALQNGIDLITKQGGKIFPSQKGSIMKNTEKVYYQEAEKTYFVSYGILNGSLSLPKYPCKKGFTEYDNFANCGYFSSLSSPTASGSKKFDSMEIGAVNLPALCKDIKGGCDSKYERWDTAFSIQAQLEAYVSNYTKDCVEFENLVGVNNTYNITEGDVSTNITFSETSITANVNYPLVFAPAGSQPVIKLLNFQSIIQTRFKQAFYLARYSVINDVMSQFASTFDMKKGFEAMAEKRFGKNSGFNITIKKDIIEKNDLVTIIDAKADPRVPLKIQFMIQNRPPVLEYMNPIMPQKTDCGTFDVKALQERTLDLIPKAWDPDEDEIEFSYYGWLENYSEYMVVQGPEMANGCPNLVGQVNNYDEGYVEGPRRWSKGANGALSAYMTKDDTGFHNITIKVCDNSACDYQTVRIFIDDLFRVVVNKTNIYGNEKFSLEDPMEFTAEVQDLYKDSYTTANYKFDWTIDDVFLSRSYNGIFSQENKLNLPVGSYDISEIDNAYDSMKAADGNKLFRPSVDGISNKYLVTAFIESNGYREKNETAVYPLQCISYETTSPPYRPSYPYNTTNPYLSNHTCCKNDLIQPSTQNCFSEATYGSFASFSSNEYNTEYDDDNPSPITKTGVDVFAMQSSKTTWTSAPNNANNIFKRTFTRKCDGDRGNICVGNRYELFTLVKSCNDAPAGQTANCIGPPLAYTKSNSATSEEPNCGFYYDGTTFEKEIGLSNKDSCNPTPKCTDGPSATGYIDTPSSSAHWICTATCGAAGGPGGTGCIKTTAATCHNCYLDQTCKSSLGDFSPTTNSFNTGYSFEVKSFNTCGTGSCSLTTSYPKDSCKTDDILIDYRCVPEQNLALSGLPYSFQEQSCRILHEKPAVDEDSGALPNFEQNHNCVMYEESRCNQPVSGAAFCVNTESSTFSVQDFGPWYGVANGKRAEWYVEYYAENKWGSSYAETCEQHYVDYDLLDEEFCLRDISGAAWIDDKCCGDDYDSSLPPKKENVVNGACVFT